MNVRPGKIGLRKRIRYLLEAAGAYVLYAFFRILPPQKASDLGGWIGRTICSRFGISRRARQNLALAFPEKTPEEREAILLAMWDNLGRVIAEYPHLARIADSVSVEGAEHLSALRDDGLPALVFGAHLANWEMYGVTIYRNGLPMELVYRAPNNPWVEGLLARCRDPGARSQIQKGTRGARDIVRTLREGGHVGLLLDQKLNEGLPVPFFGREAMTAPAIAQFALRFSCPIVPAQMIRTKGAGLHLKVHPPLRMPENVPEEKMPETVKGILQDINAMIEGWVRENPGQWFWIHRRWPD